MSEFTNHTIQDASGQARQVTIHHQRCEAVQYDFYIPNAIWDTPAVQDFRERLFSVEAGATVFNYLHGVWKGTEEQTCIYRMVLRAERFNRGNILATFQNMIGDLMAQLSVTGSGQEVVMFTETEIIMHLSGMHES